ncbi:MAG: hypothetical protein ACR2HO_03150 [Rubrobacteraceae bacterium]|nr:hypothetical protein [Rubrobacter sp.]
MAKIEKSVNSSRDADEARAYVSGHANDTAWREGVIEMTHAPPGPARPGTRMHEVLRFMGSTYVTDSGIKEVRAAISGTRSATLQGPSPDTGGWKRSPVAPASSRVGMFVSGTP